MNRFWVYIFLIGLLNPQMLLAQVDTLYQRLLDEDGVVYDVEQKKDFDRRVKEIIAHYRGLIQDDETNADAHYKLARLYMVLNTVNDRQRAKRLLDEAIRLNPNEVDYQLTLGKLLLSQMFWRNGYAQYEKVVETFPYDLEATAQARYWMGYYALQEFLAYKDRLVMGNDEFAETDRLKAIALFKQSIEADPDFRDPYYHLGLVYLESQQPDSLIHYARRLIQREPEDAHAFLFCGLGYQSLGEELKAYEFYTTALNMLPDDEREMITSLEYVATDGDRDVFSVDNRMDVDRFWLEKDPLLLTDFNESQMDHYRRVAYANLRFSRLLRHIPGWQTDKGKTYIKFGPYASRSVYERRETWHYGDFRIHFRKGADLDAWYFDGEELGEALASLNAGYWPDHGRVHFEKQAPKFYDPYRQQKYSVPYQVSAFASADSMRLEVAYAIPVNKVDITSSAHIDQGLFLFDAQWDSVYRQVEKAYVFDYETHKTPEGLFWIAQHALVLPVDDYQIVAEVGDYKNGAVGTMRMVKEVVRADTVMAMSDVILASKMDVLKPDPTSRADIHMVQNPLRTFRQSAFLHLYFEVYHLVRDVFGRAKYDVSYRVGWPKGETVDASLFFAIDKPDTQMVVEESALAPEGFRDYRVRYVLPEQPHLLQKREGEETETEVTVHYEGDRENELIYLNVDLSQVPVGVHQLRVQVQQGEHRVFREVFFRVVE
jgi:GWxTD domain-containing protein